MNTGYYVSVIDGMRKGLLLGPYGTHQEALDNVQAGNNLACNADPRAIFLGAKPVPTSAISAKTAN